LRSFSRRTGDADTPAMPRRPFVPLLACFVLCASASALTSPPASAGSELSLSMTNQGTGSGTVASTSRLLPSYRPDAWIKLCGLSTGCVIGPPPPHPWRGDDIYNTTGLKQKVGVRLDNGEGVRFWIQVQNDGALEDSVMVQGCKGTPRFFLNAVLMGKQTKPNWQALNVTKKFKNGTLKFVFPPSSTKKNVVFTVNIVTPTPAVGVTYRCPITISSVARPAVKDRVVAVMTTY
jgi:hypothetical protein